jgi:iron complex outermembrane receptor protein
MKSVFCATGEKMPMSKRRLPLQLSHANALSKDLVKLILMLSFPLSSLAAEGGRRLEEVIVTAQKRAESLQDVPASVASFDRDFAVDAGIVDIGELVQYTPNIKFVDAGPSTVLTIRGLGTPPGSRGIEPSVGLVIDDVFYGRTTFVNDAAFDIEAVEVLRGPQGTIFGKNTIAGVMSLKTRRADFDGSGYVEVAGASYNDYRIEAGKSLTLAEEKLAARVAVRFRERDSWTYNTTREEQHDQGDAAIRLAVKWLINDSSDLVFSAWTAKQDQKGLPIYLKKATEQSLSVFREFDPETTANAFDGHTAFDSANFSERDANAISAKFSQTISELGAISDLNISLLTAWTQTSTTFNLDGDMSPIKFFNYGSQGGDGDYFEQYQAELLFDGELPMPFDIGESLGFLFGLYASSGEHGVRLKTEGYLEGLAPYVRAGGYGGGAEYPVAGPRQIAMPLNSLIAMHPESAQQSEFITADTDAETDNQAVYAQFDWDLLESLTATVGLRYGEEQRVGTIGSTRSENAIILPTITGQVDFSEARSADESSYSYKVSLSWRPTDDVSTFVTIGTGSKGGGFAAGIFSPEYLEFKPENAINYEVGVKSEVFGGATRINASIFRTNFDDLQVRNFDGVTLYVTNAAAARTEGLEVDFFTLTPLDFLNVGGSLGFINANYVSYPCAPAAINGGGKEAPESCGTNASFQDLSGEPLAFAPKSSASLYANALIPLWDSGIELLLGLDALYQGEHYIDSDNDVNAYQEETLKISARLGVKSLSGWSLILNAKNLTGEQEEIFATDQAGLAGNYWSVAMPESTVWTLTFRYESE